MVIVVMLVRASAGDAVSTFSGVDSGGGGRRRSGTRGHRLQRRGELLSSVSILQGSVIDV